VKHYRHLHIVLLYMAGGMAFFVVAATASQALRSSPFRPERSILGQSILLPQNQSLPASRRKPHSLPLFAHDASPSMQAQLGSLVPDPENSPNGGAIHFRRQVAN